jgi:hypothetical protein
MGLVDHANIDLEYARQQLRRTQWHGASRNVIMDCINRAQHALDRVADAHGNAIVTLSGIQLEPTEPEEWTTEEILAREG